MPSTATSILDGLSTSVAVKAPCRTVATANITLAGLQTISGYTTNENDRVLVVGQTDPIENGIYMASTGNWSRAKDADGARDLVQGTRVIVRSSTVDGVEYELTTANPITIGTTALTFTLRYGANATYDQTAEEIAESVTPIDYSKVPGDLDRYDSIYDLENVGDVIIRAKTETALPFADANWTDITGDLTGRGAVTVAAGDYDNGFDPGDIAGYYYFRLIGDGRVSIGLKFDGNGQGDYIAYQPADVNVYFYPLILQTGSAGQKAIGSHLVDACGHAIEGVPAENAIIALNTGDHQNGVGVTSCVGFVSLGNAFRHGSDSTYFLNSVRVATHVGNTAVDGVNGGGVDLVGSRETACVGNSYSDQKSQGIWVLHSPNTGQTYRNVLTAANVLRNNRNLGDLDTGEITTGHRDHLGTTQGENAAHIGNLIDVRLSVSSTLNWAFWNHPLADKTFHVANVTVGETNTVTAPTAIDEGAPRSHYAFNVACPDESSGYSQRGTLYYAAAPTDRAIYAYNVNWRIHPDSIGIPTEMESGDGFWQYHIVRALPQAGIRLMEVRYEGGLTHDFIEVTVASRNDSGLIKRTFITRGQTGSSATVLDNNLDKSFGNAIPTLTIAATTGKVTISAAGNAGVANNQLTAFFIKIVSAEDYPERFVPVFAT